MRTLAVALILTSVLTFAVATALILLGQPIVPGIHTGPEGFSRASSNLALIAIALGVWFGPSTDSGNEDDD
ncbi:MAG TPA: hypothetical protein VGK48_18595 [Terriglobia bacterium]|jgi:hypothetical protein